MSYYNEHEPPKGYACVHIAQKEVALEDLYVQKAILNDLFGVPVHYGRVYQRLEEFEPLFVRNMNKEPYKANGKVYEDEYHSQHERKYKIIISAGYTFSHNQTIFKEYGPESGG